MSGLRKIRSMLEFHEVDKDQGVERNYLYYKDSSHHYNTEKQGIDIIESQAWGKMLFLDGVLQSTTRDEVIYHSALVHPVMAIHPNATRVLILGGGEGATAREVLRYKRIVGVTMIDYDRELVEIMREKAPEWSCGALSDTRLNLVYEDAWEQVPMELPNDLAIIDLTDPNLKVENWLVLLRNVIQNIGGGSFVMNAGLYTPWATQSLAQICKLLDTLCREYPGYSYSAYTAMIPSFNGPWTFFLVSQSAPVTTQALPIAPWIQQLISPLPVNLIKAPATTYPDQTPL